MSKVPVAAWVCATVAFLGVVTAFVVLAITDTDAAEFRGFLNIFSNLAALVLGGGSVIYSGAAASNSQRAVEQTNGSLDARIAAGVAQALAAQREADTAPGGEFRRG